MFTNPSADVGYDTRTIFKQGLTGLNSEFSFSYTSCLAKAEEHSQPYYLPIAGGRITVFIPFPTVLVLCEMQSVSSRNGTRVAVSISYDDNYYITCNSNAYLSIYLSLQIYQSIYLWWSLNKFPDFFRVGTFIDSTHMKLLRSNLLWMQCTCCAVPTTSARPHGRPLVWACQWPSSQPLSSPQLSHNDSLWAKGISKSHREQDLDCREVEEVSGCPILVK